MRMMVSAVTAVMTAVTVVLGTAVPTSAQTVRFRDPNDMVGPYDILRVQVRNGPAVTVTTTFEHLPAEYRPDMVVYVDTRPSRPGPEFAAVAHGEITMLRTNRYWSTVSSFPCPLRVTWSFAADRHRVRLPPSCLGGHRGRVRVGLTTMAGEVVYADWAPGHNAFYGWVARG
jgi:hypothetical protein